MGELPIIEMLVEEVGEPVIQEVGQAHICLVAVSFLIEEGGTDHYYVGGCDFVKESHSLAGVKDYQNVLIPVSYTHLTLPTICSV